MALLTETNGAADCSGYSGVADSGETVCDDYRLMVLDSFAFTQPSSCSITFDPSNSGHVDSTGAAVTAATYNSGDGAVILSGSNDCYLAMATAAATHAASVKTALESWASDNSAGITSLDADLDGNSQAKFFGSGF